MRGFNDMFVVTMRLGVRFFVVRRGRGDLGLWTLCFWNVWFFSFWRCFWDRRIYIGFSFFFSFFTK